MNLAIILISYRLLTTDKRQKVKAMNLLEKSHLSFAGACSQKNTELNENRPCSLAAFVLPWEVRANNKKNLVASFETRTEAFQGGVKKLA